MTTIVAAVDLSDQSTPVVEKAVALARKLGASLQILHVVAPEPDFVGYADFAYPGRDERADELHREKTALRQFVDGIEGDGISVRGFMKEAPTVEGIVEFADHHRAEILVIGTHSKGLLRRLFVGSTAHGVISRSEIPVLVVPPASPNSNS